MEFEESLFLIVGIANFIYCLVMLFNRFYEVSFCESYWTVFAQKYKITFERAKHSILYRNCMIIYVILFPVYVAVYFFTVWFDFGLTPFIAGTPVIISFIVCTLFFLSRTDSDTGSAQIEKYNMVVDECLRKLYDVDIDYDWQPVVSAPVAKEDIDTFIALRSICNQYWKYCMLISAFMIMTFITGALFLKML